MERPVAQHRPQAGAPGRQARVAAGAFLEYCRKVSRQEDGQPVQWGLTGGQGNLRVFMSCVWGNGGDLFDVAVPRSLIGLDGLYAAGAPGA